MNKEWIDEKLEMLYMKLSGLKLNAFEFFFEPTKTVYEKLESGDEQDLQSVAAEISSHIDVVPIPAVRYDWGLKMEPEVAGQIKYASLIRSIQIPFYYVGKKYAVGCILAHEMGHAFLSYKGIWLQNPGENEMFTDLTSVFIGLGKLLLNGQVITTDESPDEAYTLGYLSPELTAYCYEEVIKSRAISREVAVMNLTPTSAQSLGYDF